MTDLITTEIKFKEFINDICSDSMFSIEEIQGIQKEFGIEDDTVIIRKGLTPKDIEFKEGENAVISYISTKKLDRDKEIVLPKGAVLSEFKKHPVVCFKHNRNILPIGKSEWIKLDDNEYGLMAKTIYNVADEFAKKVYDYRKAGFPLAQSMGFLPIKRIYPSFISRDSNERAFLEEDLKRVGLTQKDVKECRCIHEKYLVFEYSDVPVPANPEALQIAISKGLINADDGVITKEIESNDPKPEEKKDTTTKEPLNNEMIEKIADAAKGPDILDRLKFLTEEMAELKEGRVLSKKSIKMVGDVIKDLDSAATAMNTARESLTALMTATDKKALSNHVEDDPLVEQERVDNDNELKDSDILQLVSEVVEERIKANPIKSTSDPLSDEIQQEILKQKGKVIV